MLVAYEASGLIRFTIMLFLWPIIALLNVSGYENAALKLMIFVAMAGVRESEIELVSRAVLLRFYMDDLSMDTWKIFSSCKKKVVVTRMPRVMVERFAKKHLGTDEEHIYAPVHSDQSDQHFEVQPPKPVIFYDGRFVKRPKPVVALLTLLWIPFGIIVAAIRMSLIFLLPLRAMSYVNPILGIQVTAKGKPPQPPTARDSSLLFVGNHRTLLDGFALSHALGRTMPSITFTRAWFPRILSAVPIVRITRKSRNIDAEIIKQALSEGDLTIYPEGVVLQESGLFRATARSSNGLDLIFEFMNPRIVFEITFLKQLPIEDTCSSGKSPYDVANHVQRIIADTLGFECTNLTKKDKYKYLT
ncbi:unnamed protein product [Microthlaspi erraticum]|uniref:Phospholipid/glycerol acyltransferase domain-containing protein n=1 Tax=Microthlaspi erraticum TaxID=1685480 RepID=A0A6D2KQ78_9BRAS|nr:unnamed protein product [Microthlaspi erraticum]CAA7054154.1 unnamed protein product [Microthlaspi erraticum]